MPPLLGTVSARRLGQAIVPSLRPVLWAPHFSLSSRPESLGSLPSWAKSYLASAHRGQGKQRP